FGVAFTDNSQAIFRADAVFDPPKSVPEPTSTLGILVVGALGIFIRKSVTVRRREDF
ncbi:MAG: PEP-CTERM sorting domain-containing protein, partial [Tolypothrix sp. T3-bin4]|nr:PEP-CTERM sorting domain-containing protein [Tolypothrix sp. T3-bin4]